MKLSLHLVTWNGARWLPGLFESLRKMDFRLQTSDFSLLVLDNGSTDGTLELLKKELPILPFPHELIELKENIGFAGGHNRLFLKANEAEYLLIFNQDMIFEPDCIEKLVQFLETHQQAAAITPRLMRLGDQEQGKQLKQSRQSKHDIVDSLGLRKYLYWRVADIKQGKRLKAEGRSPKAVFGVSGACAMFRVSALRTAAFPDGTIFDESYGSYKEDADLAFRMKRRGLRSFVLMDAVAYHARGSGNGKKDQPFAMRYQSYRNHLATIGKNFSARHILDLPFVLCYEAGKFAWYFLFDRKALHAWTELWSVRKALYERRQHCLR